MTAQQKTYGLIGLLAIGVFILLVVLFKGKGSSPDQDLVHQLIAAKDSIIASKNENIAARERLIEEKERTNEALQQKDSVLNAHYLETEQTYKKINEKIKDIPNHIARIADNNDSLRSKLAEY